MRNICNNILFIKDIIAKLFQNYNTEKTSFLENAENVSEKGEKRARTRPMNVSYVLARALAHVSTCIYSRV